jgi:hypothetical protein
MSPDEESEFIAKHKINFLGPLPVSHWPTQYVSLFNPFREIENIKYDDYFRRAKRHSGTPRGRQMRETIRNTQHLQRTADDCRKSRAREQDWRGKTEIHLFRRFSDGITWYRS